MNNKICCFVFSYFRREWHATSDNVLSHVVTFLRTLSSWLEAWPVSMCWSWYVTLLSFWFIFTQASFCLLVIIDKVCGVCSGWWCIQLELSWSRSCPYVVTLLASLESWIHFKWELPPLLHRWQHLVTKYTTHVTDRDTINKWERLVSRFGECVVLILLREAKIFHREWYL